MFNTKLGTVVQEARTTQLDALFGRNQKSGRTSKQEFRKRVRNTDSTSEGYLGPWGGFDDEAKKLKDLEHEAEVVQERAKAQKLAEASDQKVSEPSEVKTSIFHGKKTHDWQGRSWISAPTVKDRKPRSIEDPCFLPKRIVHTWKGHKMGVQTVRLMPGTGHLMLSASMDSTIKIWDCLTDRECRMTYTGHSQAVRDVQFAFNGEKFYSCSFDTNVHLWDTETGKVISTFTNDKMNYCIAVHPKDNNSFIVGNQLKKAIQFDALSGKVVQEYNEHLGSVSSVTFCDEGKKLVTTSDDRKIFVWNYGIPVVDKYISEPHFHSVPAVTVDPSGKFFAGQSMNNTIIVYQATGDFKYQAKRRFLGHNNAGYAIQPAFSTDGKYLMSGSSDGRIHFWDWKSTKLYRSLKAHDGVCMSAVWHPTQSSRIITCGWDSLIKMWE